MSRSQSTAILLFTRTSDEEARYKTWIPGVGRRTHARIATLLIRRTRRLARCSGLPLHVITSDSQEGDTFGERLANAFSRVFDLGYEHVIAIGNDTLSLSSHDIQQAAEALSVGKTTLGAALDGGAYLIGLSRASYDPIAFSNLPWETARLFDALKAYAFERNRHVAFLSPKGDADNPTEFTAELRSVSPAARLILSLRSLLASLESPDIVYEPVYIPLLLHRISLLRAPPVISMSA